MGTQLNAKLEVSSYCDDVLGKMDGVELAKTIESKEISPQEAIEASIQRVKSVNPKLNAVAYESFGNARERASSELSGPLAGVPTFIKDNECVQGETITFGSRAMPETIAPESGDIVKLNEAMGFISLGKSTLPEFGLTATTESLLYRPSYNPWHTRYSTGGSSGGAAALVAAGVIPIAHANDGGGSIRIPAASCGLVGLKPSRDRLGVTLSSKLIPIKLFTQGVLSRSVRDTAHYYSHAEKYYQNPELPKIGLVDKPGTKRLKVGVFTCLGIGTGIGTACDEEVANTVFRTASLCEQLGHHVDNISSPFDSRVFDDFALYWCMLAFYTKYLSKTLLGVQIDKKKLEPFTQSLCRHFLKKGIGLPLVIRRLNMLTRCYEQAFSKYDILLTPTMGTKPPEIGCLGPDKPLDSVYDMLKQSVPFTCFQNISGAPAISLPLGFSSQQGLPIGVQFAAAFGQERQLLELAMELEEATPWHD